MAVIGGTAVFAGVEMARAAQRQALAQRKAAAEARWASQNYMPPRLDELPGCGNRMTDPPIGKLSPAFEAWASGKPAPTEPKLKVGKVRHKAFWLYQDEVDEIMGEPELYAPLALERMRAFVDAE